MSDTPTPTPPSALDNILQEISGGVNLVGQLVGAVDPALIPAIIIGKSVSAAVPSIVADVEAWIGQVKTGTPPTDAQNQALAQKIAALANPAAL